MIVSGSVVIFTSLHIILSPLEKTFAQTRIHKISIERHLRGDRKHTKTPLRDSQKRYLQDTLDVVQSTVWLFSSDIGEAIVCGLPAVSSACRC